MKTDTNPLENQMSLDAYAQIVDGMPLGVALFKDQKIVYANEIAVESFGVDSLKKLKGRNPYDFIADSFKSKAKEIISDLLETERGSYSEKRFIKSDGDSIFLRLNISELNLGGEQYRQITFTNVTSEENLERELAEHKNNLERRIEDRTNELTKSEQFNRSIIDSTPDCIKILSLEGRLEFMSENGLKMMGIDDFEKYRNVLYIDAFWKGDDKKNLQKAFEKAKNGKKTSLDGFAPNLRNEQKWWGMIVAPIYGGYSEVSKILIVTRDITDRKKYEKKLSENEEKFRKIFHSSAGLLFMDANLRLTDVNQKVADFLGYEVDELCGEDFHKILCKENIKIIDEAFDKIRLSEIAQFNSDYVFVKKNGDRIWGDLFITPVKDEENRIINYVAQVIDISERKKFEKELKKFKRMIEHSPAYVVITDDNGIIEYINPRFTEITGWSYEEAIGNRTNILKSGKHSKSFYNDLWDTIKAGKVWRGEFYNKKKNGELYWEKALISSIKDQNGEISHYFAIKEDVTEKKEIELKIKNNLRFLTTLINTIPTPVFYKDFNGIYLGCNKTFEEFLGIPEEKIVGSTVYDIQEPELARIFEESDKKLLESDGTQTYEAQAKNAIGEHRDVVFNKAVFYDAKGQKAGIIGIMLDVTERKKNERKIQKTAKELRDLNATKDKFFSIIAHDLRNPFNVLITMSKMLLENFDSMSSEEATSQIESINKSAKYSHELLENLLNWSRSQIGTIKFEPNDYDIYELVINNIYMARKAAENKNIKIDSNVKVNTIVFFDYNMIDTVIRNLLANAIKFTEPDGKISLDSQKNKNWLEIKVTDTGVGIPPENIDKLFKIDEAYSTKGTNNEKGSGLGLILCKEFVEKHRGTIKAESKPGKGSSFSFAIPRDENAFNEAEKIG